MGLQTSAEFDVMVHNLHHMGIVIVRGAIDLANIHLLEDAVDHVAYREVPLLLDLANVRYIDSTGLHFIQQVHEQCASKHVPFAVVANAIVRRLSGLLSLDAVVAMFPDTTLAREHLVTEWRCPPK